MWHDYFTWYNLQCCNYIESSWRDWLKFVIDVARKQVVCCLLTCMVPVAHHRHWELTWLRAPLFFPKPRGGPSLYLQFPQIHQHLAGKHKTIRDNQTTCNNWRFPKIGALSSHPFLDRIFHEITNQLLGIPHDYGNSHFLNLMQRLSWDVGSWLVILLTTSLFSLTGKNG